MPALLVAIALSLLTLSSWAQPINDAKLKLIESQRNLLELRNEQAAFEQELEALLLLPEEQQPEGAKADLIDSIAIAHVLIDSSTQAISRQRRLIAALEQGSEPSALDIALTKAMNADLGAIAKSMPDNEAAQREIERLRELLKREARVGGSRRSSESQVEIAQQQQIAEQEFLKLLTLFGEGKSEKAPDKALRITGIIEGRPFVDDRQLAYLGHGHYHTETPVHAGAMSFTVDGKPWNLDIPERDDRAIYVLIYDTRLEKKPRMVMFNKELLMD